MSSSKFVAVPPDPSEATSIDLEGEFVPQFRRLEIGQAIDDGDSFVTSHADGALLPQTISRLAAAVGVPIFYVLAIGTVAILLTTRGVLLGVVSLVNGALVLGGVVVTVRAVTDIGRWVDRRVVFLSAFQESRWRAGSYRRLGAELNDDVSSGHGGKPAQELHTENATSEDT